MIKILFICHGNICRSTMAEFVLKHLVKQNNLAEQFYISSKATHHDEIGNDTHQGTKQKLREMNIPFEKRKAAQIVKDDYNNFDYIICMDNANVKNVISIVGKDKDNKVKLLLSFDNMERDIKDPWYTGNFDETYDDINRGCQALLNRLTSDNLI